MKFLLDQDVFALTRRYLESLGHDIVTAAQLGLSRAKDSDLLKEAEVQNRIFVTRDRDFGALVFIRKLGAGVIYLRILPSTLKTVHEELGRILNLYDEEELKRAFIVVEPGRHRFRRIQES